jgi:hypothetical protein
MTFLVDRNLQTFLPVLVAATAGILVIAWDRGWGARVGLIPLVLMQVVWGADAMFYSGHDRLRSAVDLIRSGFAGTASTRFASYQASYVSLGKALPDDATVLLHGSHAQLGINHRVLLDWAGFQGLIDYRPIHSVRELDTYYRSLGITHVVRELGQRPAPSKQEDVLLSLYLSQNASSVGTFGGLELLALPTMVPAERPPARVVLIGVRGYADGAYQLDRLGTQEGLIGVVPSYPMPDTPLPQNPAYWPAFLQSDLATVIGDGGNTPGALLAEVQQHQQRQRVSPGALQIFAPH